MLKGYIDLLKHATDSLTSFGHGTHGTFLDYIQAVGLEFAVVLLGILFVAGIVLILSLPVWGIWLSFKGIDKHSICGKWEKNYEKYREFWSKIHEEYKKLSIKKATEDEWLKLQKKIEDHGFDLSGTNRKEWFKKDEPCQLRWCIDESDTDFPGKFACGYNNAEYYKSDKKRLVARIASAIGIIVVYVMLMLPFVLMWL